jgi:hypothetical protein
VTVRVSRRGVKTLHRQGYILRPVSTSPQTWSDREWRAAVGSPLGSAAIHIRAEVSREKGGPLLLALEIAATDFHFSVKGKELVADFDIVVAEKSANEGRMQRQGGEFAIPDVGKEPEPIRHTMKITPHRETETIRVLVRDRFTGQYGSLARGTLTIAFGSPQPHSVVEWSCV